MSEWFQPESPKLSGRYKRPVRASGRNRSIALIVAVTVLLALYFVGCAGVRDIPF